MRRISSLALFVITFGAASGGVAPASAATYSALIWLPPRPPCCADVLRAQFAQARRMAGIPEPAVFPAYQMPDWPVLDLPSTPEMNSTPALPQTPPENERSPDAKGSADAGQPSDSPNGGLVVHEWGTFTSFTSTDGLLIEHNNTIGSDLPEFVYDRAKWTGDGRRIQVTQGKNSLMAEQRMETPVIYFYSDRPQTVDVRVSFPAGLLTEFYPAPLMISPPFQAEKAEPIEGSTLEWRKLAVVPVDQLRQSGERGLLGHAPSLMSVDPKNHYIHARDTNSDWVRECLGDRDEYEKFLFYRGVGNFKLPIKFESRPDGSMSLTSEMREPLPAVFVLMDNCCGISDIHFAQYENVSGRIALDKPLENTSVSQVADAITRALEKAGLYELEARAMVKTWQESWLTDTGMRVLYILPRYVVDEILPLDIQPAPQNLTRVFVGRIESLWPEQQAKLEELLTGISKPSAGNADDAETIIQMLRPLGRFAEPALRAVAAKSTDDAVRRQAERLIARLHERRPPAGQ